MWTVILLLGSIALIAGLSKWLRRFDESGYPSSRDYGEERHPEPGIHYRPLEAPPSPPFD